MLVAQIQGIDEVFRALYPTRTAYLSQFAARCEALCLGPGSPVGLSNRLGALREGAWRGRDGGQG